MTDVTIASFPRKFRLEFETTNDAFFEAGYMYEVQRIMTEIAGKLPTTLDVRTGTKLAGAINDHNGNAIGRWVFEK